MAVTRYTLTGDFNDIVGEEFAAKSVKAFLTTNLPAGEALIDLAANKIQVGAKELQLDTNGAFSESLIATNSADTNVAGNSLRYRVTFSYINPATRTRDTWDSDYFELTANSDLADILGTIAAPISWRSTFITDMEAIQAAAEAARDEAVAYGNGFTVGTVTTGAAGSSASASIVDAELNLTIPRGDLGPQGPQGLPGPGAAAWTAGQAVAVGAVRQAPDGSWIKSTANRTTGSSFDATEQGFWTPVLASAGTLEASALSASFAQIKQWARNPDLLITGAITRDANGAATSAAVTWPDGTPGTYTADTVSSAFPGAVDAYHITYGSPVTKTFTQPAVTRDATTGAVTNAPAITVS